MFTVNLTFCQNKHQARIYNKSTKRNNHHRSFPFVLILIYVYIACKSPLQRFIAPFNEFDIL